VGRARYVGGMLRTLLLFVFAAVAARADLVWEKGVQEFHVTPEEKAVTATFAFKNSGPDTLVVKRVRSSCGCTTARLDKNKFAPGERGEVEVKFTFGSRRGPQQKIISVEGDDKQEWRAVLRCYIHEAMTVSPALVYWKVGEAPEAKAIKLTAAKGERVKIMGVKSSSARLSTSVETVAAGSEYVVKVKPAGTDAPESAELTIETDFPTDAPRSYRVFARIK